MDGKHVVLQAPFNSGSEFFNYKSSFSVLLFTLVDANYSFLFVDCGCQGRISDGGVFKNSELFKNMENQTLSLPSKIPSPSRTKSIQYFMIGYKAFPLNNNNESILGHPPKR